MADYFDLIARRESCRDFDPERPIEKEQLVRCLEAARIAPSACNSQPWKYIVVTNPQLLAELKPCVQSMGMNKFVDDCPAMAVIIEEKANLAARTGGRHKDQDYASIDIGLSASQFCYAALEQGLSTCILGWFSEKRIKTLLNIDPDRRVRLLIALGYAKSDKLRTKKRKPLSEMSELRA